MQAAPNVHTSKNLRAQTDHSVRAKEQINLAMVRT